MKNTFNRKYLLSYDTIDGDKDFGGNHEEVKKFLLCVFAKTSYLTIHSCTRSSLVIEYDSVQLNLFDFVEQNLKPYFYYSICQVAKHVEKTEEYIQHHCDTSLDEGLKKLLENLNCETFGKKITEYQL